MTVASGFTTPSPEVIGHGACRACAFVVQSELETSVDGIDVLEQAFGQRLRAVDERDGFCRLEVWRDEHRPGRYLMVSWWRSADDFTTYMRSSDHRASHARVPRGDDGPRPIKVSRCEVIAR